MKKLLFILFNLITLTLSATTYYIDPSGSDAAAGTIGAPWQSLYKAVTTATTFGDIIHVNAGSYTESHQCPLSPGVSIEGAGKLTTTINATNTTNFGNLLALYSVAGTDGSQHITGVRFESVRTTSGTDIGVRVNGRSNVSIHDCHFEKFRYSAATFNGRDENTGGGGTTFDPFVAPVGDEYATGNSFYDNTTNDCSTYRHDLHDGSLFGYFGSGHVAIGSQDGFEMYGCVMTQDNGVAGYNGWLVKIGNSGFVKNCYWHDNTWAKNQFNGGYLGDFDFPFVFEMWNGRGNNRIENNTCVNGGIDLAYHGTKDVGTYSWILLDNDFSCPVMNSKQDVAIILEAGCDGALIKGNTMYQMFNGIIVSVEYFDDNFSHDNPYRDIHIEDNLLRNMGAADASGDTSITNNDNGAYPIYIGGIADSNREDLKRIYVDHNTIIGSANHKPYIGININNNLNRAVKDSFFITNNVVINMGSGGWLHTTNDVGTAIGHMYIKNNLLNGNGNSNNYDLAAPNAPTPTVSGNILGSAPVFTTPAYTLASGSPGENAATGGDNIGWDGGNDTIPPTVTAINPTSGATGVSGLATITITFSEVMDPSTLISANVVLSYSGGSIPCTVTAGTNYVILTPLTHLPYLTVCDVDIDNVQDALGNAIASPYNSSFTTAAAPTVPEKIRYIFNHRRQ